jgi:hypothetical protein
VRVLIACEFSGIVREAFKAKGHDAWFCDLLPTEIPGQHIQGNVLRLFHPFMRKEDKWDLMIAFPPCTYLTVAGNKWFKEEYKERFPERNRQRDKAVQFFMDLINLPVLKIAIENPRGIMSTRYRKPDQIIQPYEYGHKDRKMTCLWLKGLPLLMQTHTMIEPDIKRNRNGKTVSAHHDNALRLPADERWKARSRTYQGIAEAMANQWG